VAARRPDLVAGLVTMAADPDFTEDLLWKNLKDEEKEVRSGGAVLSIKNKNTKPR
jgi:hypothetical protein